MAKQLTFIHAADLHIGAPFRGVRALSEQWAKRLSTAILEAYERVIRAAIDNKVDFVIIAGDVFDTARASYSDYMAFFKGMEKLHDAGIPAYLVTGNHDPYTSWGKDFAKLPDNVTMFGTDEPTFALYERDGAPVCLLGGRSFYNQTWPADKDISEGISRKAAVKALSAAADDRKQRGAHAAEAVEARASKKALAETPFAVGVLHTGLDKDFKAPVDPGTLLGRGMDYWALGHIHKRMAYPSEKEPRIVFSGDIQGRDINEEGSRGCYLVALAEGETPRIKFIPTASVVWQKLKVDISDCDTVSDVTAKILRNMFYENGKAQCEEMCVRVTLTGETPLHETLKQPGLLEDVRESVNASYSVFFCDALIDATTAPINKKALANEGLFPALLMGIAQASKKSPDDMFEYLQSEFIARGIEPPDDMRKRMKKYTSAAENMVLDLLMEDQK